jgi:hypothetical protein
MAEVYPVGGTSRAMIPVADLRELPAALRPQLMCPACPGDLVVSTITYQQAAVQRAGLTRVKVLTDGEHPPAHVGQPAAHAEAVKVASAITVPISRAKR